MLVLPSGGYNGSAAIRSHWAPTCLFMVQFQPCIQTEVQLSFERWAISWQATFLFPPIQTAYKTICFHTRVQASFIDRFLKSAYPRVKDLSSNHMPTRLHKFPILQLFLLKTFFFFLRKPMLLTMLRFPQRKKLRIDVPSSFHKL